MSIVLTKCNLADTLIKIGELEEAEEYLRQSLQLSREIGDRSTEALALKYFAELYDNLGNYLEATKYCTKALTLATELGSPLAKECEELQKKLQSQMSASLQEIDEKDTCSR